MTSAAGTSAAGTGAAGGFAAAARRLCGQAGLLLGWRPEDFWRATPDELGDALGAVRDMCGGGGGGEAGVDRVALGQLMELYPDG